MLGIDIHFYVNNSCFFYNNSSVASPPPKQIQATKDFHYLKKRNISPIAALNLKEFSQVLHQLNPLFINV